MTQNEKKENEVISTKTNSETPYQSNDTTNQRSNGKSSSAHNSYSSTNNNQTTNEDSSSNLNNSNSDSKHASQKKAQKSNFIFINFPIDVITYILIVCVIYSSYLLFDELPNHVQKVRAFRPEYKFPTLSDLNSSLYIFLALILIHKLFKYLTVDNLEKCLSKRYSAEEIQIYKHKVSTNIIKFGLYLSSTILGYVVLKDSDFFPWLLGGSGEFKNYCAAGYPEYLFFEKPQLFDFYYNFNLGFAFFDMYILLTYPLQSDFLLMILHHFVTFNLVIFSFLVNFSHGGSIVFFVHYTGDVMMSLVRICIHLNISELICCYLTIVSLAVFVYTRLFVFGGMVTHIIRNHLFEDYNIYSLYLLCCIGILVILNIIWIVLISKKVVYFLLTGKVEEIYKFKKTQLKQEDKKDL